MKAQCSRHNETQIRPVNAGDKGPSDWQLLSGLSLSDIGLMLVGFAGLGAATAGAQALLYSVGGMFCLVGLTLIWVGTSNLSDGQGKDQQSRSKARSLTGCAPGSFVGSINELGWLVRV